MASAKTVEELEPLPNIDFNIMPSNSLIGLILVDAEGFGNVTPKNKKYGIDPTQGELLKPTVLQGNLLQMDTFNRYQEILVDKNKSIELYKKYAFNHGDQFVNSKDESLLLLRQHIDKLNADSQEKLYQLLLKEFSEKLKIKYEEAQPTGKPKKRLLTIDDIQISRDSSGQE